EDLEDIAQISAPNNDVVREFMCKERDAGHAVTDKHRENCKHNNRRGIADSQVATDHDEQMCREPIQLSRRSRKSLRGQQGPELACVLGRESKLAPLLHCQETYLLMCRKRLTPSGSCLTSMVLELMPHSRASVASWSALR